MRLRYFGSRYFAADFFAASGEAAGAVTGTLNVTENADSLSSQADIAQVESGTVFGGSPFRIPRLPRIEARLDVKERGDTLVSFAQLGPDPVEMDNNLLLMAA